jgi:hypothetical protein
MTDLLYVDNLRVAQAKAHEGDLSWYVVNAAGAIVKGKPGWLRIEAEIALQLIRKVAYEEAAEERLADGIDGS